MAKNLNVGQQWVKKLLLDFADFKIPVSEVVLYTQFSHKK
jgi:hypothetical protein